MKTFDNHSNSHAVTAFAPDRFADQSAWLNRRAAECLRDLANIERLIAEGAEREAWDERTPACMNLLRQGRGACMQLRHIADLLDQQDPFASRRISRPSSYESWRAAQFEKIEAICNRRRQFYSVRDVARAA